MNIIDLNTLFQCEANSENLRHEKLRQFCNQKDLPSIKHFFANEDNAKTPNLSIQYYQLLKNKTFYYCCEINYIEGMEYLFNYQLLFSGTSKNIIFDLNTAFMNAFKSNSIDSTIFLIEKHFLNALPSPDQIAFIPDLFSPPKKTLNAYNTENNNFTATSPFTALCENNSHKILQYLLSIPNFVTNLLENDFSNGFFLICKNNSKATLEVLSTSPQYEKYIAEDKHLQGFLLAIEFESFEILDFIFKKTDIDPVFISNTFQSACINNKMEVINYFLTHKEYNISEYDIKYGLNIFCENGEIRHFETLLHHPAINFIPNTSDYQKWFYNACGKNQHTTMDYLFKNAPEKTFTKQIITDGFLNALINKNLEVLNELILNHTIERTLFITEHLHNLPDIEKLYNIKEINDSLLTHLPEKEDTKKKLKI